MSPWRTITLWIMLWGGLGFWPHRAGAQEIDRLLPRSSVVADKTASGGRLVQINLENVRPGPIAMIPLMGKLPGKYIATLRIKMNPVDSYADGFVLSAGNGSRLFMGTTNPDPKNSDYRLWVLPFIYEGKGPLNLSVVLNRQGGMVDRPAHQLLLDRLDIKPIGPVYIESIRPNKVCYDPNEEISCDVVLHFPRADMEVRALESTGLGLAHEVVKATHNMNNKLTLKWNAGAEQYGREVRVELVRDGKVIDSATDVYNVTDNVWKIAMAATVAGMHMSDPRSNFCSAKTDEQLAQNINIGTRSTYGNFKESFAWAPDDAFDMTPTEEYWISGQGTYQHKRSRILLMNKLLLDNGIWPITYAKSAASGPPVFEYMRKHPDFALTSYQSQFDQEYVEKWDKQIPGQEKTIFYTWLSCVLNIMNPEIVDAAINEILNSSKMFGWRGARYDDHYALWGQPQADLSTKNMERIFALGKQANPSFVWGFNYLTSVTPFAWPQGKDLGEPWKMVSADGSLLADPPTPRKGNMPVPYGEFAVACKNGGFIMNEEARGASAGTYTNYAQLLTYETRLVRGLGGHYGPIPFDQAPHSAFDAIYPDILRSAARAHSYGQIRGGPEMLRFLTRYSAFIYGTDLEPIADPEPLINIEAQPGVWWHNYCYTYQHGADKKVVVHLLSVPRTDKISDNRDGEVSKIHGCSVVYCGPEKVVKAYELSPFIEGYCRELPIGGNAVKPSDFYLWSIIVLELGK